MGVGGAGRISGWAVGAGLAALLSLVAPASADPWADAVFDGIAARRDAIYGGPGELRLAE